MARRTWRESDHPRHPGGSDQGGRFRERVGSGGWAARLNAMLGGRRGASERTVGRAGGRSDLGDPSADDLRQALAESDADYARGIEPRAGTFIGNVPETHGNARPMDEGGNLPRLTSQEVADALAPRETPIAIGSFESLGPDIEPGVKEASGQNLVDYPALTRGEFEVYDPDSGFWTGSFDAHEEDIDDDEFDDRELEEMEESGAPMYTIVISGANTSFRVDPDESVRIRRRQR